MGCIPLSGNDALEFFQNVPVPVGTPTVVDIGFVVGLPYEVVNRTSAVNGDCVEHVAWTAEVQQG